FTIGPDRKIVGKCSREATQIFQRPSLEGFDVIEVLFEGVPAYETSVLLFAEFCSVAFTISPDAWSTVEDCIPAEVIAYPDTPRERALACECRPIVEDGKIDRILVLVTDETLKRRLEREVREKEEQHSREMAATRRRLAGGAHLFVRFLK